MLTHFLLGRPLTEEQPPLFMQSRCLRMRHRENDCDRCLSTCPRQALAFSRGLVIKGEKCSSCYLCTAVCPSDALAVPGFDFRKYLQQIAENVRAKAVIGCRRSRAGSLRALPCLGLLSPAHLAALAMLPGKEIEIDIEPCRQCSNSHVGQILQDHLESLPKLTPGGSSRARLSTVCEPLPLPGRRDFFAALKASALRKAAALAETEGSRAAACYNAKLLPLKRQLVNDALQMADGGTKEKLRGAFCFSLIISEDCDLCAACRAGCPTGALRQSRSAGNTCLQFQSAACTGCGLCVNFCRRQAIRLTAVEQETEVFAWRTIRRRL